jgi:hypothetical protein
MVNGNSSLWRPVDQPVYLLQPDRDRRGGRLALLTDDAQIETLGRLEFRPGQCYMDGRHLACLDLDGRTHLLRVDG